MRRMLGALLTAALVLDPLGAYAQKTKAQLNTEVSTNFPDNTAGAITPSILRTTTSDIIASMQQYASVNAQSGTTYTIQLSDYGQLVIFNNASPVAVSLPQATGSFATFSTFLLNQGAGTVTVTPTTSTINGAATFTLTTNQSAFVVSNGTNYFAASLGPGGGGGGTITNVSAANGATTSTGGSIVASGSIWLEQANPGGRLTVVSGGCNVTTDQTAQTSLYYAPCFGRYAPIYDGTVMAMRNFTASDTDTVGLTLSLASSASWTANTIYDEFIGLNSGIVTLCTGPAWTNSGVGTSTRGTGAGTAELQLFKGFQTNKNSMTCRSGAASTFTCAVNQCTYVGTTIMGASNGTIDLKFGTSAANGGLALLSICNAFNRIDVRASSSDSSASWIYNPGSAAFRAAHAGNTNVSFISCNGDVGFSADYASYATPGAGAQPQAGLGLNSNTLLDTRSSSWANNTATAGTLHAHLDNIATAAGLNTVYALEASSGGSTTFNGFTSPFNLQQLTFRSSM